MRRICKSCGFPISPKWQDGKTVGERLKLLRATKRIGVREAAALIGMSATTLSNMENDKHKAKLESVCKVIDFYNVSYDEVLRFNVREGEEGEGK